MKIREYRRFPRWLAVAAVILGFAAASGAQTRRWSLDFENGAAFNGMNDVASPGDTGTRFSLTDDFQSKSGYFFRLRMTWQLGRRHALSALAAPLRLTASGPAPKDIRFFGAEIPAGAPVEGRYRFDSYRLTYRYTLIDSPRWTIGVGFTAKIRSAGIRLESGSMRPEKTNLGFVPLLHARVEWKSGKVFRFLLEADALAAPQGRAEDVLAALLVKLGPAVTLKAGYRIVEGGADNEEVYNFALIHYAVAGLIIEF